MHHGDKNFALDSSTLLDMGFAIFLVLLNKIFTVTPPKTKPRLTQSSSMLHVISNGINMINIFINKLLNI